MHDSIPTLASVQSSHEKTNTHSTLTISSGVLTHTDIPWLSFCLVAFSTTQGNLDHHDSCTFQGIRLVSIPVLKPLEKNPLAFHDWELDIACRCSHKYIMARSRAIGGLSVHKKHTLPISALLGWRDL